MGVLYDDETGIAPLWSGVEIEYPEDGCMRREVLATDEEADEIALRAIYNELDMAQIAVTRTLSVGTSIVWLEVERRKLENQRIHDMDADVPVIGDIMRTVVPIIRKHGSGQMLYAADRAIPFSQFIDEYPQPKTQLRNSITIKSGHRNVHVDLAGLHSVSFNINIISGDSYFGAIHGGNIGGRNNVNTCVYFIVTLQTEFMTNYFATQFAYRALLVLVRLVRPGPCVVGIPHSCKNKQNHREESVAGYNSDRPVLGHIEIRMQSYTPRTNSCEAIRIYTYLRRPVFLNSPSSSIRYLVPRVPSLSRVSQFV
ncbi:hypothetical protein PC9H_002729 [Pleurotus ostreatus]|uniref:Uncharacterized protein n=1 Tax=Pleurotus ostreatus TaxID=5322 RepID=A0A8H6ZL93_PLEOS|nr:uncharacterized protein PC9H_002729 [Pleurotus ostreatus]KAF7416463.1 hypothetical protein PC9H_002729 [Pleurotus ostreatus]